MDSEPPATEEQQQQQNKTFSLEEANEEITLLLSSGKVTTQEVSALQGMTKEHAALREKVVKLKSLLGRSAKAQREAKVELDATQKRLQASEREVERLQKKVEKLASRPTHMDLLADFETNFDRALLSAQQQQAGGQDTAAPTTTATTTPQTQEPVVDSMLLQELSEARSRIDHLESLQANLKQRAVLLERENKTLQHDKQNAQHSIKSLQLELRMAQMEAEHATRAVQDKTASLAEMQMEIDMVTKASVSANVRAAHEKEASKNVLTRQEVQELQNQVQALQEWALASAEAKQLAMEHVSLLEKQLKQYKRREQSSTNEAERTLWSKTRSLVVGAGDVGFGVLELGEEAESIQSNEHVVLRWKFDCTPADLAVDFNILKGVCDSPSKQSGADYLIKNRVVMGGAAGEMEAAFAIQNACTLLWSNETAWVRPSTIKYVVDAVAIKE